MDNIEYIPKIYASRNTKFIGPLLPVSKHTTTVGGGGGRGLGEFWRSIL
jgi:hypothetical protein